MSVYVRTAQPITRAQPPSREPAGAPKRKRQD